VRIFVSPGVPESRETCVSGRAQFGLLFHVFGIVKLAQAAVQYALQRSSEIPDHTTETALL
jgi:hypothetical protein